MLNVDVKVGIFAQDLQKLTSNCLVIVLKVERNLGESFLKCDFLWVIVRKGLLEKAEKLLSNLFD